MTLADLEFDNRFTAALPADPSDLNRPRQVHAAAYTRIRPTPVSRPRTIAVADEMLELIGLDRADAASPEFAAVFSGNAVLDAMDPFAMNYGGHQFGNWAGQLGDGRAIGLGEAVAVDGSRQMLQLKGAGPTPYSRSADGRAVLRSSVREFLCSEAMHHLGVPTTRALSLVLTGDQVVRDMFYDGAPGARARRRRVPRRAHVHALRQLRALRVPRRPRHAAAAGRLHAAHPLRRSRPAGPRGVRRACSPRSAGAPR